MKTEEKNEPKKQDQTFDMNSDNFGSLLGGQNANEKKSFVNKIKDYAEMGQGIAGMMGAMGKPINIKKIVFILILLLICAVTGAITIIHGIIKLIIYLIS